MTNQSALQSTVVLSMFLASAVAPALHAEDAPMPAISVRGLRIVAPEYGATDEQSGLRAFNWFDGTSLAVLVLHPDGGIIDIDDEASTLDKFTDDKGTNLLEGEQHFGSTGVRDGEVSKDAKAVLIEITGPQVPAAGATRLYASGTIVLVCATKREAVEHKNVALKPGTEVKEGPLPFKITRAGKPEWGEEPLEVELEFNRSIDTLAEVKFLDAQGNPIESRQTSTFTMGGFDSVTVQQAHVLSAQAEAATIVFEVWTDMTKVKAPFDINTSVGF